MDDATRAHAIGPSRVAALLAAAAIVGTGLAWELWLAPTGRGTLAVKVLPLALALPGLWSGRLYTFRWVSLVVWLYVGEGLVRATSERGPAVPLAWLEVGLGCVLFAACGLQVRARLAEARRADAGAAAAAAATPPGPR